jgi:hypothetical protein
MGVTIFTDLCIILVENKTRIIQKETAHSLRDAFGSK